MERQLSRQRSALEEESLIGSDLFSETSESVDAKEPRCSIRTDNVGAKAKRAAKELEKMRKNTQKRAPKYILTCGFAGAGKSNFSTERESTGNWIRANQDEMGGKKG